MIQDMTTGCTPLMEQYWDLKEKHKEEILFFRLGDFYEMFFEDAELASRELELTLTSRDRTKKNPIPMCGVPYHSAESYIARLINKGYRVAICEQVEDPKEAKGIVKREVIKIITPGTVLTQSLLSENESNFLALLHEENGRLSLAATDISTGEFIWAEYDGTERLSIACDQLYHLMPAELLATGQIENFPRLNSFVKNRLAGCLFTELILSPEDAASASKLPAEYFSVKELELCSNPSALTAIGFLLHYLQYALKSRLSHINKLTRYSSKNHLVLDAFTLRNLEVTRNLRDGSRKGTLLSVLDFTQTAMGGRFLKKCLEYPLINQTQILRRQDAIAELVDNSSTRNSLTNLLKNIYDLERIMSRIEVGTANARDLIALKDSLVYLPEIKAELNFFNSELLLSVGQSLNIHADIAGLIEQAIADSPPLSIRDGDIIKKGYDGELDDLRELSQDSKKWIQDMETKERETTGIKSLKVGYNKVFGYYIEVTHANTKAIPSNYIRKQTLVNAERYITPDLKDFETKILGAQEKIVKIEYHLFTQIREEIKKQIRVIQKTARQIAQIDVLTSLSQAAALYNYVRPSLNQERKIEIKDGRHPVVERLLTGELFVPNDTMLNHKDSQILIITGPNMSGKSTYMRQTALLLLMAQTGSFIPAREANISIVDRIFTRVGASDDLASGQSTFMVEMNELAQIIKYATPESLLILDEIGRGTSTFDGMSIARSVIEYIDENIRAKTLFATHYHELTELAHLSPVIKNYSVAVKERDNEIIFLRRIIAGGADKSYGIYVAELAGLPQGIIKRAQHILKELEELNQLKELKSLNSSPNRTEAAAITSRVQRVEKNRPDHLAAIPQTPSAIVEELLNIDIMTTMPLEALNILSRLIVKAQEERREISE